jgi:hypothetical protein
MYKVKIKNKKNDKITNSSIFKTIDKYNAWIDKHKLKGVNGNAWGLYYGFREMAKRDVNQDDLFLIYEEYEKVIEDAYDRPVYETYEDGNIAMEDYTYPDANGNILTSKRPKQKIKNGSPVFEHVEAIYQTWVKLSSQYEIEVIDITAEHDAAITEKEARGEEIRQLKRANNIINNWNSLDDINLPFLKKFFKRILKEMKD